MTPEQICKTHRRDLKNPAYKKRCEELKEQLKQISNRYKKQGNGITLRKTSRIL